MPQPIDPRAADMAAGTVQPVATFGGSPSGGDLPTSNIAPYYGPYIDQMLGQTGALANTPYQPYTGEMYAPTQELYNQAFSGIGQLTTPSEFNTASNYYNTAYDMAKNLPNTYNAQTYNPNQVVAPTVQAAQFSGPQSVGYQNVNSPTVQAAQFSGPQSVGYNSVTAGQLGPQLDASNFGTVQNFMDPYQQAVTDIAKREATRNYNIQSTGRDAQAVRAGAFGGDRQAILEAEAQRNLNQQLNDLQMQGNSNAYNNAMQAINAQRGANIQAGTTNIDAGLRAGLANQGAGIDTGKFNAGMEYNTGLNNANFRQGTNLANAGYNMQGQSLNQGAGIDTGKFNAGMEYNTNYNNANFRQGTNLANAGYNMQGQGLNQNAGLDAARLNNQDRQFGSDLYGRSIGYINNTAAGMTGLGGAYNNANLGNYGMMLGAGGIQQGLAQNPYDFGYKQWQESQAYPYNNLNFMRSMLSGLPLSVGQTPSTNPWLEGLAGASGIWNLFNK